MYLIKEFIKKIISSYCCRYPQKSVKFGDILGGKYQVNINLDLINSQQKKVLFSYLSLEKIDLKKISHANYMHFYQMLKCFIDLGYCIDVCACDDTLAYELLKNRRYHIVIGQGKIFKEMCKEQHDSQKIIFVTENNPMIAREKYAERISYFEQRHPNIDYQSSIMRNGYNGYIDEEMFRLADFAIIMNSEYNTNSMRHYFEYVYTINSNALFNTSYIFDKAFLKDSIEQTKYNFLWFGSVGLIHKGVDVLIDAFKDMPNFSIDFYGLDSRERVLFDKLKVQNTIDCGRVNVQDIAFVEKIVNKHCFIIFPSCSEGMSTAVATCMAHGLIPILTKESGFNSCECILELKGWRIEDIKDALKEATSLRNEDILTLRENCYRYARTNFSLENFTNTFREIMKSMANMIN